MEQRRQAIVFFTAELVTERLGLDPAKASVLFIKWDMLRDGATILLSGPELPICAEGTFPPQMTLQELHLDG